MRVKELLKKKRIFNAGFLFLFNVLCILAVGLFYIGRQEYFAGWFVVNDNWLIYVSGIQIILSLLSIISFQLMVYNGDEPILGISYGQFFLTDDIVGKWNYSNCLYLLLEMMGISVISTLVLNAVSVPALIELSGLIVVFCLVISVFLAYRVIYLGILAKYRKSRLYYRLLKKLGRQRVGEKLYFQIRKDIDSLNQSVVEYKKYDEYLIEKLTVYIYILLSIETFEPKVKGQEMMSRLIMERIRWMIARDTRKRAQAVQALKINWVPLLSKDGELYARFGKIISWIEEPKKMNFVRDFYTSFRYVWGQKESGYKA